jgi:septum formation protein
LASASPQRRGILEDLGLSFTVQATDVDEIESGAPESVAVANAIAKARAADAPPGTLVIGCDTVVATEAGLWGKPTDAEDAKRTLEHLSGRTHQVVSGLAVVAGGELRTAATTTLVTFVDVSSTSVTRYVQSGEWEGRAGGYAIQGAGATLVARIDGDLLNVIGLPVCALREIAPELHF